MRVLNLFVTKLPLNLTIKLNFIFFLSNRISANVSYLTFAEMSADGVQWCFQLLKDNMKPLYVVLSASYYLTHPKFTVAF